MTSSRCLLLLLFTLSACSDDVTSTGGGPGAGGGGAGGAGGSGGSSNCEPHTTAADPDFSVREGRFTLQAQPSFAVFSGMLLDGPPLAFHHESAREGQCRLLTYEASTCAPACTAPDVCIDAACATPGSAIDAGTLTLTEFLGEPIPAMKAEGSYYWSTEDVTGAKDRATLTAAGGPAGDFALSVCVPSPMTPSADWTALMEARAPGEDVTLEWSDPLPGARFYLRMTTGIGTHGGISPVEVECEGPDTGSLTLPGPYLDDLFAEGWSCGECGDNRVQRYAAAEAALGGATVRFSAQAEAFFYFHP
jgi:hypothetical protein